MLLIHYGFQWISIFLKIAVGKASGDKAGETLTQAAPGGCKLASQEGPQHLPGQRPAQPAPNSMFTLQTLS